MKKLFVLLALVMGAMSVNAQHLGSEYRLKKVIPVAGRQGIAVDKDYYYVSDTKVLYKYDKEGNMLMKLSLIHILILPAVTSAAASCCWITKCATVFRVS